MELNKELIIDIDELLTKIFKDNNVPIHSYGTSQKDKLREKSKELCKALNLIRAKSNSQYELDEKGILAIQDGGIENYLNKMRLDRDLERTVKDLTKENLKKNFKRNLIFVSLGGLIGLITGIATLTISMVVQQDSAEQYINKLNEMVEQDKRIYQDFQTDIQQMRSEITSLEKQIDSLKNASY